MGFFDNLADRINRRIDTVSVALGADPSIQTNRQILELIKDGVIDLNNPGIFVNFLAQTDNSIWNARDEIYKYLEAVPKRDRKVSESLRSEIDKKLGKGVFTTFVNDFYTKREITQKRENNPVVKYIEQKEGTFTFACRYGIITQESLDFIRQVKTMLINGQTVAPNGVLINLMEEFYNDIKEQQNNIKKGTAEVVALPDVLQRLQKRISPKGEAPKALSKFEEIVIQYDLNPDALRLFSKKYLREHYNDLQPIDPLIFLSLLGMQLRTNIPLKEKDFNSMRNDKPDSTWSWAKNDIRDVAQILGKTIKEDDTLFVKYLKRQYTDYVEMAKILNMPQEQRDKILSEPIRPEDSDVMKRLKQEYAQMKEKANAMKNPNFFLGEQGGN